MFQNSRHPLLSSSVILSMKRSFLTTASHYKMAALLSDSQCHLRSEKENQDNSGRSCVSFSSVQFSCSVMSDSLWPHESQHARPPCLSPTPGVHSNSCPSSQWCHLLVKVKLCRNLQQLFPYVLVVKSVKKSTLAARQSDRISILAGLIVTLKNLGLC